MTEELKNLVWELRNADKFLTHRAADELERLSGVEDLHFNELKRSQALEEEVRRSSAERASVLEECAKIAEEQAQQFLSPEYASNQPFGSTCERFACGEVAKAIRELIPVSVGSALDSPDSSGVRALK